MSDTSSDTDTGPIDEGRRREFESAWARGKPRSIEDCLPAAGRPERLATLEELVLIELEFVSKDPAKPTVSLDDYLHRFPELDRPEIVTRLRDEAAALSRSPSAAFAPGRQLGRYKLVVEHARGGFGAVWRAVDDKLGREIALKHLSPGVARDRGARTRFVHEAKVTARLEHPGVVPVYDMANLEDEPFYYAMKLIRGKTLAEAIADLHGRSAGSERSVELRRLLGAFLVVCQSMEYAHAGGVVHRDLKPQNVVLSDYGETVILDWGLAKETDDDAAGPAPEASPAHGTDAVTTLPGTVKGTPAYMAPEQAAGLVEDVDEQSDVYALGAILYQILTGRLPFDGETSDAVLQKVIEGDKRRPRAIDPRIDPPLEAVCLAAMDPNRDRRYATVGDLTRDLQRFLADEPVSVYREPLRARFGRWTRRHRALVAGLSTATLVVVAALAVIAAVLTVTNEDLRAANGRERQAKTRAEENFSIAKDAVQRYFTTVSESRRLRAAGLDELRRDLLGAATGFYERLTEQRSEDPVVERERGRAYLQLAMIKAETVSTDAAIAPGRRAQEIFRALAEAHPETPLHLVELAKSHNLIGALLHSQGLSKEAEAEFLLAIAVHDSATPGNAELEQQRSTVEHNYARLCADAGRLDEAATRYRKAMRIRERGVRDGRDHARIGLAMTHLNFGTLAERLRKDGDAEASFRRAVELCELLREQSPDEPRFAGLLAGVRHALGIHLGRRKQLDAAKKEYEKSLEIRRRLVDRHPGVPTYLDGLAGSQASLGSLHYLRRQFADARRFLERARDLRNALRVVQPSVMTHAVQLADIHRNLGDVHKQEKRYAESRLEFESATDIDEELVADSPENATFALNLGKGMYGSAGALYYLRKREEAVARLDKSVAVFGPWWRKQPESAFRDQLAYAIRFRAQILDQLGEHERASGDWKRALRLVDAATRPTIEHRHALSRGRGGASKIATAYAEKLRAGAPDRAYDAAVLFAVAAEGADGQDAESAADAAVKQLERALRAGWFNTAKRVRAFKRETAFEMLTERPDYERLRKEIERR